jgi:FMN-dependent NADH-azoreductase
MANVLYITAHPLQADASLSMAVGQEFIETYKKENPCDEVVHLDLYKADIPYLDADVFSGWEKLRAGNSFEKLETNERLKVGRLAELGGQFLLADKYVFVTPMWNFSIPAIMKTYIDAIAVSGKTFKYTRDGAKGLLKGKKAVHIQARGGIYSEGPDVHKEMGHRYLEVMMDFFGIESFETIAIEGQMIHPEKTDKIKTKAIGQAKDLAHHF